MAYDEDLAARLRRILDGESGVTEKKMFGGQAFLINGHLAVAASSKGGLMVRVDPEQSESLLADDRAAPFVMRGRELDGWLRVEVDAESADEELQRWADIGVAYAVSLPPK